MSTQDKARSKSALQRNVLHKNVVEKCDYILIHQTYVTRTATVGIQNKTDALL